MVCRPTRIVQFVQNISIFCFQISIITCHLKDLGERRQSLSGVIELITASRSANINSFPFDVQFVNKNSICSGSILTKKTLLTTAHCFDYNINIGEMIVLSASQYPLDYHWKQHTVWEFRIHPHYNTRATFSNNIAIILIRDAFIFGSERRPTRLVDTLEWMRENETSFIPAGLGTTSSRGGPDQHQTKLRMLRYISREKCMESYRDVVFGPDAFCLFGDGTSDTGISCIGGSGGGILWKKMIVGIVSHGDDCFTRPGIYVNVYYHAAWINKTTEELYTTYWKIIGGTPVPMEKFPHSVQLYNRGAICAGTILSSWVVLSASHCFDYNEDTGLMDIHAGSRYTYDMSANVHKVWYFIKHENYNKAQVFACDIALVFIEKPFKFTKTVKRAILVNTNRWMVPGTSKFTAVGWGWTKYGGKISKDGLMMTQLRFIPLNKCMKWHNISMTPDMFCLYGNAKRDSCKGDSGGGVMWHGMIVGIVSHGDGCAQKNKPSVYSNVWYFRKWIKEKINAFRNDFCARSVKDGIVFESDALTRKMASECFS